MFDDLDAAPSGPDADGATPLEEEESRGLIPDHLRTKAELNQWEAVNVASGHAWAFGGRTFNPLSVEALKRLHRRMFGETWTWAGSFRRSDKNISPYHWSQVGILVRDLVENIKAQYEASDRSAGAIDDIAVRFHHQLVRVHPWPNGNGRHARLATDQLLRYWGQPAFTWGSGNDLASEGETRSRYIAALRAADAGSYQPLRKFVRS
jgi:Fic-DOC domain mobile mystery protein B